VKIKIYVEGGGNNNNLRTQCRRGFSEFLRKAGMVGHMPRVVACGSRTDAYRDFCTAIQSIGQDDFIVLLVDSEAAVNSPVWDHLQHRDGWPRPAGASDQQAHLMVQCMEAWFLADCETLQEYYGAGFRDAALPGNPDIERVDKTDLQNGLKNATRRTQKGEYNKGRHSFDLLARINPDVVISASPHARLFIIALRDNV
jgi:Domain of unknown function (DUF4276)